MLPSVPVPRKDSAQEDSYDETGEEHGRIQALDLMAVAVGCKVEGPVVGDAARRVRVKPFSRPQTKLMPPHPLTQVPLLCRQFTHITWRPLR